MNQWSVRPLNGAFGAEIEGAVLQDSLDDEDVRQLRGLIDDRGLLVFRDVEIDTALQEQLTYACIGQEAPGSDRPSEHARRKETFISNKAEGGIAP